MDGTAVDRVLRVFETRFGLRPPDVVARAPGRVNLIGDHTDYNDGFVLPMTMDRAAYLAVRRRPDDRVVIHSADRDDTAELDLSEIPDWGDAWWRYVGGAAVSLRERGHPVTGFEGVVHGTVPIGSGLSSSAALVMATIVTLEALFGFELDGPDAARLGQEIEHRFAGVRCGIMDPFAARMGRADHALFLDCRSLEHAHVPLDPERAVVVVIDSRKSRTLAGSKYNERRAECERGLAVFRSADPTITALRDVSAELLAAHEDELPDPVDRRCRHVVEENQRVLDAVRAIREGEYAELGRLMSESHTSLRDLYEVSSTELDLIAETASATPGVLGARMTGAGFGGCAVALAEPGAVTELGERLRSRYQEAFGMEPALYPVERGETAGPITV